MEIPNFSDTSGIKGVWLVGGYVRDFLLDTPRRDIDYAVEADSYDHFRAWLDGMGVILVEKPEYYTIKAKVPFDKPARYHVCDFVMCRKDGPYSDLRRPDYTEEGSLDDDLARRDFTVNAMAMGGDGFIYDPFGGRDDLKNGILRTVRPDSSQCFKEDPLRLLKAMRFSLVKGFTLSEEIEACFEDSELGELLKNQVHVDRKREELTKCFKHDTVDTVVFLSLHPMLLIACFDGSPSPLWLEPTNKKVKR
jgi:tRNA nucleotidyltransferase/poly(A) polymerase